MQSKNEKKPGCSCCSGNAFDNLTGGHTGQNGLTRSDFLKTLAIGALGFSALGTAKAEAAPAQASTRVVRGNQGGKQDVMIVDTATRELRISATVTKDVTKPSVADWGRRFQAFFGMWGGKMEGFFVFTTAVSRADIDKAIQEIGIRSRRQIPMNEVEQRKGLKATTTRDDYLDGDPIICTIRFEKDGKIVEGAIEDFIMEKIEVEGKEVIKPYTPHFIYHGTGEAIHFPSGCILCPSDCNGGIITDNVLPLKTTVNYYKVDWERMPPEGSKVEVVLKSIFGPAALSSTKA
ncbi:MAG: hypothetical protein HY911_00810 [Desulfobacterales bacterium]|nr:hypothetical protein [Desulfobacterales bacterium]